MPFWKKKESLESIELIRKKKLFDKSRHSARLTSGKVAFLDGAPSSEINSYFNEIAISHLSHGGSVIYIDNGTAESDVEEIARSIDPDIVQIIQRSGAMTPGDAIRIGSRQTFAYLSVDDSMGGYRWMDAISFVSKLSKSTVARKQNILVIINNLFEVPNDPSTENIIKSLPKIIHGTSFSAIVFSYTVEYINYNKNWLFLRYSDSDDNQMSVRKSIIDGKVTVIKGSTKI